MKRKRLALSAVEGFTLIELMIAIAIIAVLVVIGMAVYAEVQKKSRDARRVADVRAIQNAAEAYYSEKGYYPAAKDNVKTYLESRLFPTDPKTGNEEYQYSATDGTLQDDGTCSGVPAAVTNAKCYVACAKLEQVDKGNSSTNNGTAATINRTHFCGRARQ